jgi:hypothetical protein
VRTTPLRKIALTIQPERVIVTLGRSDCDRGTSEVRLDSTLMTWDDLRPSLRAKLSRHAVPVVYLDAPWCFETRGVIEAMDAIRDVWYQVPIVLLTPALRNTTR